MKGEQWLHIGDHWYRIVTTADGYTVIHEGRNLGVVKCEAAAAVTDLIEAVKKGGKT